MKHGVWIAATLCTMGDPKHTCANPDRGKLTVSGFMAFWVKDPDAAVSHFLIAAEPIAAALFHRWHLATEGAEDAVQEGFIRAFADGEAALRRAGPDVLFAAWLHGLIRNLGREAVRRQAATHRGHGVAEHEIDRRAAKSTAREIRGRAIPREALCALTTKEREAFDLYMQGVSTTSIAARLGIGRESARERIARAWVALSSALAGVVPAPRSEIRSLSVAEMEALPPRTRDALALWMTGSSYTAIGSSLGCTEDSVRGRLKRLRHALDEAPPPT